VEDEAIIVVGTGFPFESEIAGKTKFFTTQLNKFDIDLNNEEEWEVKYYEQKFDVDRDTMRKFQDDIKLYATIVSKGEKNWLEVEDWILRIRGETVNLIVSVDTVPIFKVQPVYPRRAQERGMEGYVIVAFTITESGTIEEPYVIEGKCRNAKNRDGAYNDCSMFNSATLRAAEKLKYKPTVRDGRALAMPDVPHKFTYEIDDSYDQN
jgi:TonB family protein